MLSLAHFYILIWSFCVAFYHVRPTEPSLALGIRHFYQSALAAHAKTPTTVHVTWLGTYVSRQVMIMFVFLPRYVLLTCILFRCHAEPAPIIRTAWTLMETAPHVGFAAL